MGSPKETVSELREKLLDSEKLKNCFECGICTASCSMTELLGYEYTPRSLLEKIVEDPEEVLSSVEPWFCAWCYSCYKRCPQALKLPEIFLSMRTLAVEQGLSKPFEQALRSIVKNVPLPLVTTLVCFHPERAGLDNKEVLKKIEQIREEVFSKRKTNKADTKEKIAIIGSGPAGLTVAYELATRGYQVTVFEALREPGGMLRKTIPEYRLPKKVLADEILFMKNVGVEIRTSTEIGKNVSFESLLKDGHKAIFVSTGAHDSQRLKIEGTELKGVVHALEFLWQSNSGEAPKVGERVAVIGGGNVAVDAARTALCLGAKEAVILYRRTKDEMPANLWELKEAEEQGVKIEFLVSPKKILGKNGKVTAIECSRMQLGDTDESGRKTAIPVEGSEFERQTDAVILAIGERPDLRFLPEGIMLNEDGTLCVNPVTMETSQAGVFAGGDVAAGPASVIEAIRDGKRAAQSIQSYLKNLGKDQNDD